MNRPIEVLAFVDGFNSMLKSAGFLEETAFSKSPGWQIGRTGLGALAGYMLGKELEGEEYREDKALPIVASLIGGSLANAAPDLRDRLMVSIGEGK